MSEPEKEEEPSMEEILASIRRIISEDDEEKPAEEAAPEPKAAPEPEPKPEPEPEPEPEEEEVLELTEDDLEEDASQDDIDSMFDSFDGPEEEEDELVMEDEPEPESEPESEPEPEPEAEPISLDTSDLGIDDVDPAASHEPIMSGNPSTNVMGQFDGLSALLTTGYEGSGNTLEDLVRELLRPMLKQWLDDNLPEIAERMVAKEIARLARTKKP